MWKKMKQMTCESCGYSVAFMWCHVIGQFIYSMMWKGASHFVKLKNFFLSFTEDPELCMSEEDTFSKHLCVNFALKTGV